MCRMLAPRSVASPGIWVSTFRIRSVAAIANTPSANASRRAGLIAGRLGVALEIGVGLAGVAAPTVIDLLSLVVREIALLGRRHRLALPAELVVVLAEPGSEFVEHAANATPAARRAQQAVPASAARARGRRPLRARRPRMARPPRPPQGRPARAPPACRGRP